jgi:hypothetical protein
MAKNIKSLQQYGGFVFPVACAFNSEANSKMKHFTHIYWPTSYYATLSTSVSITLNNLITRSSVFELSMNAQHIGCLTARKLKSGGTRNGRGQEAARTSHSD